MKRFIRPIGGFMLETFAIRNFRSFRSAEIENCALINVIVGDNGAGKTSLLEGLFLASGISPELAVRTRGWRGLDSQHMSGHHEEIWEALFGDLFFNFDTKAQASIVIEGKASETRSVAVQMHKKGRIVTPRGNPAMTGTLSRRISKNQQPTIVPYKTPIQFIYKLKGEFEDVIEPEIVNGNIVFTRIKGDPLPVSFYASNRTPPHQEAVAQFSALSQKFAEQSFIEQFSKIYPRINSISIQIAGGAPVLFAAVEGLPRRIPLTLVSGGMNKLVALLLAITKQAGGIVIIDELENGFYFSHLPEIWRSLLDFARTYSCQLFISTHSYECLSCAAELAKEFPEEFTVIRAVQKDGESQLHSFGGRRFADAIDESVEIR
jgi:predicted ATPase